MKKICISLIMTASVLISFCQVQYPGGWEYQAIAKTYELLFNLF